MLMAFGWRCGAGQHRLKHEGAKSHSRGGMGKKEHAYFYLVLFKNGLCTQILFLFLSVHL
jgi:hypothetical protein